MYNVSRTTKTLNNRKTVKKKNQLVSLYVVMCSEIWLSDCRMLDSYKRTKMKWMGKSPVPDALLCLV